METIKSSKEISHIFKEGRRAGTPELSLIAMRDEQHDRTGRVAFIAGKKLGNAVWRNAAKRRMRAVCRQLGGSVPGYAIIFLARKDICRAPFDDVLKRTEAAFKKLGLNHE